MRGRLDLLRGIHLSILAAVCAVVWSGPAAAQTVVRGPYLQNATSTSMVVRWRTDSNTDSRVLYGLSLSDLSSEVTHGTMTTEHEVKLTGLSPETTYYYAIGNTNNILAGGDSDHHFVTLPIAGTSRPVRVWVIGDSGTANDDARNVRDSYLALTGNTYTQAWLMLGDNAYSDGTDNEYQDAVFDMYPTLLRQTPLWPTLGNHDGHSADSATQSGPYYDIFTLPKSGDAGGLPSGTEAYYSFDYANVHFVCLDSYDSDRSPGGPMLTWLANDLAATTQTWIVAYWHHPPYSRGSHSDNSSVRDNFLPILEAHGVDLVLSGHSHSYERSFLIDGLYDDASQFDPSQHAIDEGDGREDGAGAYSKDGENARGTVYVVAGSSGKTSGGSLDHPIMYVSLNELGSLVLDFDGKRLDAAFLDDVVLVEDYFTILKGSVGNQPAAVSAGVDQSLIRPAIASLDGTVSDDGLPDPPSAVTTTWSVVSGLGQVTFADANAVDTTASFSIEDTYVLRLTADDGEFAISDDVTITVLPEETTNQPPVVDAGPDQTMMLLASASLDGTVSDDGLPNPPGVVSTTWSDMSGPGTVTFADASAVDTTASFSVEGTYVLRLTADDGNAIAFDEVVVMVERAPQLQEIRVSSGSDDAEEGTSNGSMDLNSSDLELILESSEQLVGMRFNGVLLPQGAMVTNAYIQFKVDETDSGATTLSIQAEDIDDAPTFTSSSGNISSRARTTASVSWSPPPWNSVGEAGPDQQTTNFASVLQEVVNRPGWASGNSLVIVISGSGKRVADSYNGDPGAAPLLHLEYGDGTPPDNTPPSADAGPDQIITLPASASLNGAVTDEGLPSPPGTVTTTWSKVSGPGTVTFADASSVDTTASFSVEGTYVLRLTADDSSLSAFDELTITVNPEPPANQPPSVNAGADQTVTLPVSALLDGTVSDDGLPNPPGTVTTTWSVVSGPGTVTFADASSVDTTASFSVEGTYVLGLTADDSSLSAFDELTITVNPEPPTEPLTVTGIQPSTMQAGTSISVTITGSSFAAGATVSIENGTGGPPPQATNIMVGADGKSLTTTITAKSGGPPRDRVWDVRVTNPDGSSAVLTAGFAVTP